MKIAWLLIVLPLQLIAQPFSKTEIEEDVVIHAEKTCHPGE